MCVPFPAGALVVLLGLTSCGADDPARSGDAAAVEASYHDYWDAFLAASTSSDTAAPALAEHAASNHLAMLRRNLAEQRELGHVAKGSVRHRIDSVVVDGNTARLIDCVDLDLWLIYDAETGALEDQLHDRPNQLVAYVLARTDSGWVVTDSAAQGQC